MSAGVLRTLFSWMRSDRKERLVADLDDLKKRLLADDRIDDDEVGLIRQHLFADGKIDDNEKRFLRELHTQARKVSPEFQKLFDECVGK